MRSASVQPLSAWKVMDPVADKVLMAAAFICLIPEHAIPAWAAR